MEFFFVSSVIWWWIAVSYKDWIEFLLDWFLSRDDNAIIYGILRKLSWEYLKKLFMNSFIKFVQNNLEFYLEYWEIQLKLHDFA